MSKSLELTILLKSTFSKNISEETFETFHQIWSWSWRVFTRNCFEIKRIVSQTSCFSNQSLRTSPKKSLNLFIRYDLDPGNVSQAEFWAIFEILSQCKWDLTHFSPFKVSSGQKSNRSCRSMPRSGLSTPRSELYI